MAAGSDFRGLGGFRVAQVSTLGFSARGKGGLGCVPPRATEQQSNRATTDFEELQVLGSSKASTLGYGAARGFGRV